MSSLGVDGTTITHNKTTNEIAVGTVDATQVTTGTPGSSAVGDAAAAGSATSLARSDHRHGREAFGSPAATGLANADGAATTLARSNHVHAIGAVPMALGTKSGAQAIPNITFTTLTFDGEAFDTDTIHDNATNTGRLTATRAGTYLPFGFAGFAASSAGTVRSIRVYKNGFAVAAASNTGGLNATIQPYVVIAPVAVALAAGDYLEVRVYQDSGGSLNVVDAQFGMVRVGD